MDKTLKERRARLEKSQLQMASIIGVRQGTVARVENGSLPKSKLTKWAAAYRVTVKQFEAMVRTLQWELPLWKFSEIKTPAEIEHIDCTRKEIKSA